MLEGMGYDLFDLSLQFFYSSIQIFHVWFSFQRLIWRIDQGQVLIVYYYKCDSLLFQISACLSSACDKLRKNRSASVGE